MDKNIAGVGGALAGTVAVLVEHLDKVGVLQKGDIARNLRALATEAEDLASPEIPKDRLDLRLMRMIADTIEPDSSAPVRPTGWSPTVISGGLASEGEDSSD